MRTVRIARTMKRIAILLALVAGSMAWGQGPSVVTVNGESINQETFQKRMAVLPNMGRLINGRFIEVTPGFLTMQTLINERLMLQLARDKGVFPKPEDVQKEIDERVADNPEFVANFLKAGFKESDLRYDITVQLAEFNLTTMGVTITDLQVERFYEDQKRQFTLPQRFRIRLIAVASDTEKAAVDKELAAGKSFADVAKEMSKDITRLDGGLMGELPEDDLGKNMRSLVTSMKEGQITPWLDTESGTSAKFFLEKILASEVLPLDAKLKKSIWRKLMVDRGNIRNNVPKMMDNMRKMAKIDYSGTPFDDQLKKVFGG